MRTSKSNALQNISWSLVLYQGQWIDGGSNLENTHTFHGLVNTHE